MTAQVEPEAATAALTDYVLSTSNNDTPDAVRREELRSFVNILECTIGGAPYDAERLVGPACLKQQPVIDGRAKVEALGDGGWFLINNISENNNLIDISLLLVSKIIA